MSTIPKRQHPVNRATVEPQARTAAGDAFSGLVPRVFRLNGLLSAEGDALARPAGQTTARWQLLAMVEHAPATVARTARTLGLARQSVQRVADVLEAEGLVAYADNPSHRRARLVELTDTGRAALAAIQAAQRPWANGIGDPIGAADLVFATAILDRVIDALAARRAADR